MATEVQARAILHEMGNHRPSRDQVDKVRRMLTLVVDESHVRIARTRDKWRKRAEALRDKYEPTLVFDFVDD